MQTALTPLSALDDATLARLTRLHLQVMHTLLSELGAPFVLRYYQVARPLPAVIGLCALGLNGEIQGWAVGSPDPAGLNARLRQPFGWFAAQMLRLVFTRPGALLDLARSLFVPAQVNALAPGQVELTYIGVAPGAQRRGLGRELLDAFCQAARQAGYISVVLSVESDNPSALRLYSRAGFQVTQTFREGRFERRRMSLRLA